MWVRIPPWPLLGSDIVLKSIHPHITAELHQPITQGCAQALLFVGKHPDEAVTTRVIEKAALVGIENPDAIFWIRWFMRDHLTSTLVDYALSQDDDWAALWSHIGHILADQGFPHLEAPWPKLHVVPE